MVNTDKRVYAVPFNIEWDYSSDDEEENQLEKPHLPDIAMFDITGVDESYIEDVVSDALSDEYGFTHLGFELAILHSEGEAELFMYGESDDE